MIIYPLFLFSNSLATSPTPLNFSVLLPLPLPHSSDKKLNPLHEAHMYSCGATIRALETRPESRDQGMILISPAAINCEWLLSNGWDLEIVCLVYMGILAGFILCRSWTSSYNWLNSLVWYPCQSQKTAPHSTPTHLSTFFFLQWSLNLDENRELIEVLHLGLSTQYLFLTPSPWSIFWE